MTRVCYCVLACAAWISTAAPATAVPYGRIIPEAEAVRHGLTNAWFNQAQLASAQGRLEHVVLDGDLLIAVTNQAGIQAIDAETGRTLWTERVGTPGHPTLQPGANQNVIAVLNGSNLYVLNRLTGKLLWQTVVEGAPSGGVALSARCAYVPTVTGIVYAYMLEQAPNPPEYQEFGAPAASSTSSAARPQRPLPDKLRRAQRAWRRRGPLHQRSARCQANRPQPTSAAAARAFV